MITAQTAAASHAMHTFDEVDYLADHQLTVVDIAARLAYGSRVAERVLLSLIGNRARARHGRGSHAAA